MYPDNDVTRGHNRYRPHEDENGPDVRETAFPKAVSDSFSFLSASGFWQAAAASNRVRYESQHAYVTIFHEELSYEIDLEIGSIDQPSLCFPRSTIMLLFDPEKLGLPESRSYVAQTAEEIARGVSRLASQFAGYVHAGLFDDPKLFEHLRDVSARRLRERAEAIELSDMRQKLEVAWREKNYAKVVALLEPMSSELTGSELKKLEFSKNQLRSGASLPRQTKRRYVEFDPEEGYPAGKNLWYECGGCGGVVPSTPKQSVRCGCGNIALDVSAGRVSVKDDSQFRSFSWRGSEPGPI